MGIKLFGLECVVERVAGCRHSVTKMAKMPPVALCTDVGLFQVKAWDVHCNMSRIFFFFILSVVVDDDKISKS